MKFGYLYKSQVTVKKFFFFVRQKLLKKFIKLKFAVYSCTVFLNPHIEFHLIFC